MLPETTFPGLHFCRWQYITASIPPIIHGSLMGYIAQYNKCGFRYEGSEDIASERSENLHFRPPHSHLTPPLQRTPANIRIKLTSLETRISALHFRRLWYGSIFMQILVVGSETHVCNATECIIAVQGYFRVNQGRWFWYQSQARIRFPISD